MRNIEFLENTLYDLWDDYFADVPRKNLVLINFGKYSKRQLGSIRWAHERSKVKQIYRKKSDLHEIEDDKRISIIYVTRYFADETIPDLLPKMTIAHEMVHYAHGFSSPLPKLYDHPHKGNIVNKELIKRGLGEELEWTENWLKENWVNYLRSLKKVK